MFDLDFVIRSTGGTLQNGRGDMVFGGVSTDSRSVKKDELFIAIIGENFNGHNFIGEAWAKGAGACVVEEMPMSGKSDITLINVPSTLSALGDLAQAWRKGFSNLKLAAITGSNGKTTTKEMTSCIVSIKHNNLKNEGNFNNLIGLPLTLFNLDETYDTAVVEFGMNDFGEIGRLSEIALPDVGAITNIGSAHLEKLGGIDGVARAKGELVEGFNEQQTFVVNADDERVLAVSGKTDCSRIYFGLDYNKADITAKDIEPDEFSGIRFTMVINGQELPMYIQTVGMHNVMNALCAAGVALCLGCGTDEIKEGLESFIPSKMRLQVLDAGLGFKIINDTYNANPESMRSAIDELIRLKGSGNTVAVLGDMLELGEASEAEHRGIGKYLTSSGVDYIISYGKFGDALLSGTGNGTEGIKAGNHREAAGILLNTAKPGDLVLIKGSRGMKMEKVISQLTEELGK